MRIDLFLACRVSLTALFLLMSLGSIEASTVITFDNTQGGPIPDADMTGPGVVTSDIVVNDPRFICDSLNCSGTNFVTVTIGGLQHTFAGDLRATLTLINATPGIPQDIFNRILKNPSDPADFGCNCQFNDTYKFSDQSPSFPGDIWTVAAGKGSADAIDSGSYWTTTAGSNKPTAFSAAFSGLPAAGTWRLTISDNSPGDTGSFTGWTLALTVPVPEPSFLIPSELLVLGFVVRAARNRRLYRRSRSFVSSLTISI